MNRKADTHEKRKSEYCDKIEELVQTLERLRKAGRDTTEICNLLETVLKDFFVFRQGRK
jgi:hypothetical protein